MGEIVLYGFDMSPPVRACLLTLKCLKLPYEYKIVDVFNREQHTEEFTTKNPQHTVPTLLDDGHTLWDSHAIMIYLVSKYASDDALYPKELRKRALVNQRLFFEACHLFGSGLCHITGDLVYRQVKQVPKHKIDNLVELFDLMEIFLKDQLYMAGNQMTIADFSLITTVSTLQLFVDVGGSRYPKLAAWIKRMQQLPYYEEACGVGVQQAHELLCSTNFEVVA